LTYSYAGADHLKNEIIVIAHPRTISATNTEILWQLADGVIRVPANGTREMFVKYEGIDSVRVGAKEVSITDLTFEQGSASVTVDAKANGAELLFTNSAGTDALVKTCIVRGRKIVDRGVIEVKASDGESISFYGRRTLRLNLPSVDNLDDAQYIADFEVEWRGQPRGLATSVTLKSHIGGTGDHHVHQISKTIGDRVTISETQTGHSATYLIVGESHQIEGKLYVTTWYLEPELDYAPMLLGVTGRGEIGNRIGF